MGQPTYGIKMSANVLHILREKSIRLNSPPTEFEIALALDYIGGKTAKVIMRESSVSLESVLVALKRTRDDIRRGNVPLAALQRFPKVVAWQREKFPLDDVKHDPPQAPAPPDDILTTPPAEIATHSIENALARAGVRITPEIRRQIQSITDDQYTAIDPERPETFTQFMSEVRAKVMRVIAPLAGQLLAANLASGESLTTGLEVAGLLPKGKGITFAAQFNLGGGQDDKAKRLRSGMGFERLLDQADKVIDAEVVK